MAQSSNLYERDFYAWSNQQASLPRAGDLTAADIAHIAEEIADHLADNPRLTAKLAEAVATAYRTARRDAAIETGLALETFPAECPWSFEQATRDAR